jgi:hypothetical protein
MISSKSIKAMTKKLSYILGIILFLSLPVRGFSQTADDKADKAERAHRKHVVKKAWHDTKNGVNKAYHKVKHAPGKAIHKAKVKHQEHEKQEGETK